MKKNGNIYVVTHKEFKARNMANYKPILVGAEKNNTFKNEYLLDSVETNISYLNDSFCELTGMYWLWKNTDEKYIGISHYRRYFAKVNRLFCFRGRYVSVHSKAFRILEFEELVSILENVDFVVKQSEYRRETTGEIFRKYIGEDFWNNFKQTFLELYPQYKDEFEKVEKSHQHFNCNMLVTKKERYDEYCNFLFSIAFALDKKRTEKVGDRYRNREIGYIGEFLLMLWINANNYSYHVVDVVNIESKELPCSVLNPIEFVSFLWRNVLKREKY